MAQDKTAITITVNRVTKRGAVTGDTLHIRDTQVTLTLANVTQDDVDAILVFQLYRGSTPLGVVTSWTVNGDGNATGTLNTNTLNLVTLYRGATFDAEKTLSYKIYTTNPLIPICSDVITCRNFTSDEVGDPDVLLSPAEILSGLQSEIAALTSAVAQANLDFEAADSAHAARTDNPHGVTIEQLGGVGGGTLTAGIAAHNESGAAHNDIRLAIMQVGTCLVMQCNNGALADGKWRKIIPICNSFGQYMLGIQESPTYVLNATTLTWDEEV